MALNPTRHIASERGPTCPECAAALTLTLRTSDTHTWCFCLRCGRSFDAGITPGSLMAAVSDYHTRLAAGLAPDRRRQQLPFAGPDRRKRLSANSA